MLIIEDTSVYEIDEECMCTKKVPKECQTLEKLKMEHQEKKPVLEQKNKEK